MTTLKELRELAEEMISTGYEIPHYYKILPKSKLADVLMKASRPLYAYGGLRVDEMIIKKEQFAWSVHKPNGQLLVNVDWTLAYEWKSHWTSCSSEYYAILEACLVMAPLTAEDRALLESKRPGITQKQLFPVDFESWEIEDLPEPEVPAACPAPTQQTVKTPSMHPAKRKIRL